MERCLRKTEQMFKRMKKEDLAAVAAIVGIYGIMGILGITCPILFMTGVSCAGCGMTRAWLSLLRLDLQAAFYYHPLFWLPALIMILLLLDKRIFKQWYWLWAALFLLVYGIRMFTGQGDIVVFRPEEGFLFRVIVRMVL
ncbi:MAG: DUF2752 domain-containing protein [Lachnospiraceae bacterium]|nr:DUF2752 domain-containing protein [Lachnospiraceae bacterium]